MLWMDMWVHPYTDTPLGGGGFFGKLGVLLEPSRMGTYAKYHYQELHGYSTLVVCPLWGTIPVTQHRFHVFQRGVISQDH